MKIKHLQNVYEHLPSCRNQKTKSENLNIHSAENVEAKQSFSLFDKPGKAEEISPMWKTLVSNGLELEDPVSLKANVYLGCAQREVVPDMDVIKSKYEMMSRLCHGAKSGTGKPDDRC